MPGGGRPGRLRAGSRLNPRGRQACGEERAHGDREEARRRGDGRSAFRCFPTVSGRPKQAWHIASLAPRGSSSNATRALLSRFLPPVSGSTRFAFAPFCFFVHASLPSEGESNGGRVPRSRPRHAFSTRSLPPSKDLEAWPTRFSHQPATWPRDWNACLVEMGSSTSRMGFESSTRWMYSNHLYRCASGRVLASRLDYRPMEMESSSSRMRYASEGFLT